MTFSHKHLFLCNHLYVAWKKVEAEGVCGKCVTYGCMIKAQSQVCPTCGTYARKLPMWQFFSIQQNSHIGNWIWFSHDRANDAFSIRSWIRSWFIWELIEHSLRTNHPLCFTQGQKKRKNTCEQWLITERLGCTGSLSTLLSQSSQNSQLATHNTSHNKAAGCSDKWGFVN